MPQYKARQAGRAYQACNDCSHTWDRKNNVKDIVLCPLHAAAPALLKALEDIYNCHNCMVRGLCGNHGASDAIAAAKGE